jgi:hypothetical protein
MGNNYTAISDDASAMFFNPAGLGFTPTREISFGLSGIMNTASSSLAGTGSAVSDNETQRSRLRLGNISLLRSFPVKSGGFAIALGYTTPYILDDVVSYNGSYVLDGNTNYIDFSSRAYGQINLWTGSFGFQIAPNFAVGAAISAITGRNSRTQDFFKTVNSIALADSQYSIRQSYYGVDARVGLMYSVAGKMSIGLRMELPRYIAFDEWGEITDLATGGYSEYRTEGILTGTAAGALGIMRVLPFAKITAEIRGSAPHPEADEGEALSHWRAGAGAGAEFPVMIKTLLLRAGYSWSEFDGYPYVDVESGSPGAMLFNVDNGVHQAGGGLAYLSKSGISLEIAYAYRFWQASSQGTWGSLTEDHDMHRLLASVSVRY